MGIRHSSIGIALPSLWGIFMGIFMGIFRGIVGSAGRVDPICYNRVWKR
jgi:hypothetical protein